MPILDVHLIGPVPDGVRHGLAERIAEAAGRVLQSRPQATWVKLHFLTADAYAENAGGPPEGAQPVIVSVLLADRAEGEALAAQAQLLTKAIADACARPDENVHLIYEPPARGRVAFGGRLRV